MLLSNGSRRFLLPGESADGLNISLLLMGHERLRADGEQVNGTKIRKGVTATTSWAERSLLPSKVG